MEITVPETMGTVNLKIARLERRLWTLQQQQLLSRPYPQRRADLLEEYRRTEAMLCNLIKLRRQFRQDS
ncbi:MAG: hypothetical protein U0401_10970 [Anaerolineae bacterium]